MEERRQTRRYPVELKAEAVVAGTDKVYKGEITDISFTGVRFVCVDKIKEGQKIELSIFIDEEKVKLDSVVVWAAELEGLKDVQHGMKVVGVAFVSDSGKLDEFFRKLKERH